MAFQQSSPLIKFEASPTESFLSAPGDNFPSLFAVSTPSSVATTMNPMEMMTPQSFADDKLESRLSVIPEQSAEAEEDDDDAASPAESPSTSDKKPVKKRKSWGQVLPEPKTNLPPRKRAKTEDEKEQRRVERVLRNRRAAQSSRERKRLEVEALEKRNKELETLLINAQKTNLMLVEELNRFRRSSGVVTRSSSPLDSLQDSITLSQQLFGSQGGRKASTPEQSLMDQIMRSTVNPTVNPASLSPELNPIPDSAAEGFSEEFPSEETKDDDDNDDNDDDEEAEEEEEEEEGSEQTRDVSTDSTQRPAEMLCDLPCQSVEMPKSFLASQTPTPTVLAWTLCIRMMLISASAILSACQRPLMQIAMSSKAGFSLLPTPQLLTTIIWLVTLPPASRINPTSTSSTSTTSSPTTQTTSPPTLWQRATMPLRTTSSTSRSTTLRLKSLRTILSSSPSLARPLLDATMAALRLVSEGCDDRGGNSDSESCATRGDDSELTQSLRGITLPSREVLLTLLWALKIEESKIQQKRAAVLDPERSASADQQKPLSDSIILKVAGVKRMKSTRLDYSGGSKRPRLSR
ncbi:transcriptional activator hac1 [Trichoderma ceciliae]